nr:restriction endonuclease subunit S [Candidatus Gracilibacteria bacterium]
MIQNKIEQLIAELCPNGVEYFELVNVCKIETGKLNANAAVSDGEHMFFTTAKEVSRIDKYRWDTEALLIAGNANVGDVKHYIGKFEAYQRTYVLTNFSNKVNVRFLYFSLKNNLQE